MSVHLILPQRLNFSCWSIRSEGQDIRSMSSQVSHSPQFPVKKSKYICFTLISRITTKLLLINKLIKKYFRRFIKSEQAGNNYYGHLGVIYNVIPGIFWSTNPDLEASPSHLNKTRLVFPTTAYWVVINAFYNMDYEDQTRPHLSVIVAVTSLPKRKMLTILISNWSTFFSNIKII